MRIILITIFISLAAFLLIPGIYTNHKWDENRQNCGYAPVGGCYTGCYGISVNKKCIQETPNSCYSECHSLCYGLVFGSCSANPVMAKIGFIRSFF